MNKKFLISLVIVIVCVLGFLIWKARGVAIVTEKKEYVSGEDLKVNIKNNLAKDICFSSCYPYYLESKNKRWETSQYGECGEPNLAETCMKPGEIKGFELTLFELTLAEAQKGLHRLAVPICIDCKNQEDFKEIKRFYSNNFYVLIK